MANVVGKSGSSRAAGIVRKLVVFICIAASAVMVALCVHNVPIEQAKASDIAAKTAEQRQALAEAEQQAAESGDAVASVATATESGEKVAELQNRYQGLSGYTDEVDVKKTAEKLATHFAKGDDASSGRVPWGPAASNAREWRFVTTIASSADRIPSVWTCVDSENGRLMGYVLADYDVASGVFCNIEKHVTRYGASKVPANEEDTDTSSVDSGTNDEGNGQHGDGGIDPAAIAAAEAEGAELSSGEGGR